MKITHINPTTVAPPGPYTHAVGVQDAQLWHIAGQIAIDADGNYIGEGDLRAQMVQVFTNIQAILTDIGADFSHVVKLTMYIVDYQFDQRGIVVEVMEQFLVADAKPANTLIGIQTLARPGLLVEVEAVVATPLPSA